MHKPSIHLLLATALSAAALATQAAQVLPTSYDTPNGDGQAHGGTFNYWDKAYTGSGSTSIDSAALSGGLGDLTDGVIATQNWNLVENVAGTGPYVGWRNQDPTLTFHYGQTVHISSITLYADDANGLGGVYAPGGLSVNGTDYTFADPVGSAPNVFTVSGLDLSTSDLTFTIHRGLPVSWVFVSEVSIAAAPVPEPAAWALTGGGLLTLIARRRRTRG